jgi:hypothetical protein
MLMGCFSANTDLPLLGFSSIVFLIAVAGYDDVGWSANLMIDSVRVIP